MMKAKSFLPGSAFFLNGKVVTKGVGVYIRHLPCSNHAEVGKVAIIEVGAPLPVAELKHLG